MLGELVFIRYAEAKMDVEDFRFLIDPNATASAIAAQGQVLSDGKVTNQTVPAHLLNGCNFGIHGNGQHLIQFPLLALTVVGVIEKPKIGIARPRIHAKEGITAASR